MKKIIFLIFLGLAAGNAWAAPATVTNDGNIQVRVQYKTENEPYQDMYLKPGETKELPGGVVKVKAVREIGEWAKPENPNETIKITVKEGDAIVGVSGWYGDKVFFEGPTQYPEAVKITTPDVTTLPVPTPTPQTATEVKTAEPTVKTLETPKTPEAKSEVKTETGGGQTNGYGFDRVHAEPGNIANNGYLPMTVIFRDGMGNEIGSEVVGSRKTVPIPEGTVSLSIHEPMMFGGYTFGLKAVDLEVNPSSGDKTQVTETPFGQGAVIQMKSAENKYRFDVQFKMKLDYKLGTGGGYNFGDEVQDTEPKQKVNGRDVQESEEGFFEQGIRSEVKLEY